MNTSSLRQRLGSARTRDFEHWPLAQFEQLKCYTLSDIRLYQNADGILFPSVTHALGEGKKDSLDAWRQKIGLEEADRIGRIAAATGTRFHTMCERFLDNRDDYGRGAFPAETELFGKIKPVLTDRIGRVHAQEFPVFSLDLGVASRCDLHCEFDGVSTVVDFKTSSKAKKEEWIENYFMQATAYAMMLRERFLKVDKFAILVASPDGMQVFEKNVDDYVEMTREYFKSFHAKHGYTQQRFQEMIAGREPDKRED